MKLKKIFIVLFMVLFIFFANNNSAKADSIDINRERIENYEIVQIINTDGSVSVEEKITFYSYGNSIKNGLVRVYPKKFVDEDNKISSAALSKFSLLLDNKEEKFSIKNDSENIFIYMGDTNKKLSNGKHIFELRYDINGLINPYSYNKNKYFFFPTGNWDLAIERTSIEIIVPTGKNITLLQTKMFKEGDGATFFSNIDFYSIKDKIKGQLTLIPTEATLPGESLSLSILIPKDFVNINRTNFLLKYFGFYIAIALLLIFSIFIFFNKTKNNKLIALFLFLIPFADIIPTFFIFSKNNSDFLLSIFTILLVLEIELILYISNKTIVRKLSFLKYFVIVFFIFLYCHSLINFTLKLQAIILLLFILLQISLLNIKKKALK